MRRIEVLLGAPLKQVQRDGLQSLVGGAAREDTDLEFKQALYGRADDDKRSLSGDIAAMANTVGGAIVIGVVDADGAAAGLNAVALSEEEELRMRQTVTELVAPVPQFAIHRVPEQVGAQTGFYIIAVPASANAPHAVRINQALRYPRRDGARVRWLSESEVADAYRSRFIQASDQVTKVGEVLQVGTGALEANNRSWFCIATVPVVDGHMRIRMRALTEAPQWVIRWTGHTFGARVFVPGGLTASAGVGRIIISGSRGDGQSTSGHVELYQDGAGFAATPLWRQGDVNDNIGPCINDEWLVNVAVSAIDLLVDHAVGRCGTVGDAIVQTQVYPSGVRQHTLVHGRNGYMAEWDGSRRLSHFPTGSHQLNLEDCQSGTGLLVAARMVLTEVFQAFGVPEVPQIDDAGTIRRAYIQHENRADIQRWADARGVQLSDDNLNDGP